MRNLRCAIAICVLGWTSLFAARAGADDLTLLNGWSVIPSGADPARAFQKDGIVYLRGEIAGGTSNPIFVLPVGMRPATDVYVWVALCNASAGRLLISPDGSVSVQTASSLTDAQCGTSLDGVAFAPSASGFTQLSLANGWVHAPFSTSPVAAALIDGVVRFKGAMNAGADAVAFTLPPAMRPSTAVYVPIGLCNAQKGRLAISPNGDVVVQTETGFGAAFCFTSLDGASFVPGYASNQQFLTTSNGWTHAPFGTSEAFGAADGGVVRFRGALANGTDPLLFVLPPLLRPQVRVHLPVDVCGSTRGRLTIEVNGEVRIEAASGFAYANCFTSLDGVSFLRSPNGFSKLPLPFQDASVLLATGTTQTFTIDLGTLPIRPRLVVEVDPPPTHPSMQIQIEATGWVPPTNYGFSCPASVFSPASVGPARLEMDLFPCASGPTTWAGAQADIKIRALAFGPAGSPALVSVVIRGETRPPTGTLLQDVAQPYALRSASVVAAKDGVLFEDLANGSNGRGERLTAGRYFVPPFFSFARNALLGFDLAPAIPPQAVVESARLRLNVSSLLPFNLPGTTPPRFTIYRVAPHPSQPWTEGFLDAPGSEWFGESGGGFGPGADWSYRDRPLGAWTTPGGDVLGGAPLVDTTIPSSGIQDFESPALNAAVQDMVAQGTGLDGFLLTGPDHRDGLPAATIEGVQIVSRDDTATPTPPTLLVDYYTTEVFQFGEVYAGTISYIDAAQNFRWIYDVDQDGIFTTSIRGICEVTTANPPNGPNFLPYTYRYAGAPGYTGVDCCTWRVSSSTGVVGTGQALFFHNLDSSNPANLPPDADQDGIKDLCDNCPSHPNGPLKGTCKAGTLGAICHSNLECGTGGLCSLSQEDSPGDPYHPYRVGDVCVPEPTGAGGLLAGLLGLVVLARARTGRESAVSGA